MIKSSYRKSSAECLVLGFRLYSHNINCERINNASSVPQYPASQFTQPSRVFGLHRLLPHSATQSRLLLHTANASDPQRKNRLPADYWSYLGCYGLFSGFGQSHEMKYFFNRCWKSVARNSNGYRSWFKWCNFPYLIKQDFFGLRILHENSYTAATFIEGRTRVFSWFVISWFYFPWNVNLGDYSSWFVTWTWVFDRYSWFYHSTPRDFKTKVLRMFSVVYREWPIDLTIRDFAFFKHSF